MVNVTNKRNVLRPAGIFLIVIVLVSGCSRYGRVLQPNIERKHAYISILDFAINDKPCVTHWVLNLDPVAFIFSFPCLHGSYLSVFMFSSLAA